MAGGEGDRPRDPQAGFDRARRTDAGVNSAGDRSGHHFARPTLVRSAAHRSRPSPASAQAENQRAARPDRAASHQFAAGSNRARREPTGRAVAAADRGAAAAQRRRPAAEAETASGADAAGCESTTLDYEV